MRDTLLLNNIRSGKGKNTPCGRGFTIQMSKTQVQTEKNAK